MTTLITLTCMIKGQWNAYGIVIAISQVQPYKELIRNSCETALQTSLQYYSHLSKDHNFYWAPDFQSSNVHQSARVCNGAFNGGQAGFFFLSLCASLATIESSFHKESNAVCKCTFRMMSYWLCASGCSSFQSLNDSQDFCISCLGF